ncbi:MAG: peptide-binding protein [Beijerinckiaceae bacterium]
MPKKMLLLAGCVALVSGAACDNVWAQERCRVMDPTGTPLNVRTEPNGPIVATLENGVLVTVLSRSTDARGKPWAFSGNYSDNRPLGWVFREFIACF